jgi:hypothetical protein
MTATHAGSVLNSLESTEDSFGMPLAFSFHQSMIGFARRVCPVAVGHNHRGSANGMFTRRSG